MRSNEQKNGRKCDLATALLPKGDTRATNAKIEYHRIRDYARGFWGVLWGWKEAGDGG